MSERTVWIPCHANGSELDQLFVECKDTAGWWFLFPSHAIAFLTYDAIQIELVDFGATRTYSKKFMDSWYTILQAATQGDRQSCIDASLKIGYLTGEENEVSSFEWLTIIVLYCFWGMWTDVIFSLYIQDNAQCACNLHDQSRYTIQTGDETTIYFWTSICVGGTHRRD